MSKVKMIDFNQKIEYEKEITQTLELLSDFKSEIMNRMINIATSDKWKKWSDEQEEGTEFHFTQEMLRNTGDVNVDRLFELYDKIIDIEQVITKC